MASENAQRGSNPLLWLLGLFAVGTASLFSLQQLSEPPQATKSQAEPAKDETKADRPPAEADTGPLNVLRDYLRVIPLTPEKTAKFRFQLTRESEDSKFSLTVDEKLVRGGDEPRLSHYLVLEPAQHEFLIATVPDPVESKFPHEFDSVVDAIQRAFEARRFVLRASHMPWPRGREQAGASGDGKSPPYHECPGVLLFRKTRDLDTPTDHPPPCYAVVCLVGESPISGLHKPALTRSLDAWTELNEAIGQANAAGANVCWAGEECRPTLPPTIKIVAPYFSGSQASLILALREWRNRVTIPLQAFSGFLPPVALPPLQMVLPSSFKIINGSATALIPQRFREAYLDPPTSTAIPSELLTRGVLRYIAGSHGMELDPDDGKQIDGRVAILREANTVYGSQLSYQLGTSPKKNKSKGGVNNNKKKKLLHHWPPSRYSIYPSRCRFPSLR